MKFGPVPVLEAEGCVLAHSTALNGRTLKKGHVLSANDCSALHDAGHTAVTVARLELGDVGEDPAAAQLAQALNGGGLSEDRAFTGRVNLYAETAGLFVADVDAVNAANRIDPAITVATLPNHARVSAGHMVATAKIIPFAVAGSLLERAAEAAAKSLSIAPFRPHRVALIATELPHLKRSTMDKTRRMLDRRLETSHSQVFREDRVAHTEDAVASAIGRVQGSAADMLILFGASAVVDQEDVLPAGLRQAGGEVLHLGMPVDPGNLLMLGTIGGKPVIGAPGCARSPKENGFDWVLDRLLAGLPVGPDDITSMGVGGLLMEIGSRPQPRETRIAATAPNIAAIVLGAGKSSRMGGQNKLLARLNGKTLIRHALEAANDADLSQTVLVTGHLSKNIKAEAADLPVDVAHNPDFAEGMAGSIRTGMTALHENIDAVIVLLGDMPGITGQHLHMLIDAYQPDQNRLIVTASADGKRGNPVLWDRRFFDALKSLTGDIGARHVLSENGEFVAEVEIGTSARMDLDTREALQAAGGELPENK